jgi:membrane protease YdiL (CAAX protease family)
VTDTLPPPVPAPAPEPEIRLAELPYHRLYRAQPTYHWWRPLLAVLLLAVFIVVTQLLIAIVVLVVVFASGALVITGMEDVGALEDAMLAYFIPDAANPISLVIGLGSVAIWLPLVPLALRCAGIRPSGVRTSIVNSVTFRLRWRWMLLCAAPAALLLGLSLAFSFGMGAALGEELGAFTTPPATYALSLALIILIVPFQAAAEEFVFRGMLFQAIGSWLRWVPVALVVTTVLFASLHIYDIWGLLDVSAFGVAAILLTWRTGGLEAAIALHVVNNVVGLAVMGTGVFGATGITPDGGSPEGLATTIVTMTLYVLVVLWMARRRGIERLSRIGVPVLPGMPGPPAR